MIRTVLAIALLILGGYAIIFYMTGNHGHLMFRPHMTEDWIIWGTAIISTTTEIFLLTKRPRK